MRTLDLTPDHINRIHRTVPDTGQAGGADRQTDADYAEWVARILDSHPDPARPTRLFAYGSLIWKPEIPHVAEALATAHGWHRAFCLRQTRFRGSPEQPGLMMALDRGGQCRGLLLELPRDDLAGQLDLLFRREFTVKPITNMPRWITVASQDGRVPALAFVINRSSAAYVPRQSPDAVAQVLATACGHIGTGAAYLMHTVEGLESRGVHDSRLWALQRLVAARIEAATLKE